MKNGVFWDVTPCGSCNNLRFGGTYRLHYQDDKNRRERNLSSIAFLRGVLQLLITANVFPSSPILPTPMTEVIRSSETSSLTRVIRRHILELFFTVRLSLLI
jgi:hypothetical protein